MNSLFQKARVYFSNAEDKQTVDEQEARARDLEEIRSLLDSNAGKTLKNWLRNDISATIDKLIETREDYLISDLKAKKDLYNKLITKDELNAIDSWLEDILK